MNSKSYDIKRQAIEMRQKGNTLVAIAKELGVHKKTVAIWVKNPECLEQAKERESKKKQAIHLRKQGMYLRHIAEELGTSRSVISEWIKGVAKPEVTGRAVRRAQNKERIYKKVAFNRECWIWHGNVNAKGDARMVEFEGGKMKTSQARRIVFDAFRKGLSAEKQLFVSCGNKLCVSPSHLTFTRPEPDDGMKTSVRNLIKKEMWKQLDLLLRFSTRGDDCMYHILKMTEKYKEHLPSRQKLVEV